MLMTLSWSSKLLRRFKLDGGYGSGGGLQTGPRKGGGPKERFLNWL
jgi:hypothetical protein